MFLRDWHFPVKRLLVAVALLIAIGSRRISAG